MRVLHVNKYLYRRGGAEAYMEDVASLQRQSGDTVDFFGMDHPMNPPMTYASRFPRHVELEPMPRSLRDKTAAVGRMFWSTSAERGIGAVLDDFGPDIVHAHNIYHHLSPSVLHAAKRRRIPIVMTLHDYKLACPSYLFMDQGKTCEACLGGHFTQAVRRACKDGSRSKSALLALELGLHTRLNLYDPVSLFLCPSRFILDKMASAGVFPDRLRLIHSFVDPPQARPTKRRRSVVYASRLSAEKGVDVLVEAAAFLPSGTTVHIAGEGPLRSSLEERAERVAPGTVHFHGRLGKEQVTDLMRSCTVVVVPSRCYENQPLTVLESFGLGVAVVGSNLGGIAEMVTPGLNGELVEPGNPSALAAALTRILDDDAYAERLGLEARMSAETEFSAQGHLLQLKVLYDEAKAARG